MLLVEDDDAIAESVRRGLDREGFVVARVATGTEALEAAATDVVLLDLGLPDMDGYEVFRRLRARSEVPVIMLTARGDEVDRVVGLELGADDYVVKPFGLRELVARIRAVTRRSSRAPGEATLLRHGPIAMDVSRRTVTVDDREVSLTRKEFDLLAMLLDDPNVTHRREDILDRVWDANWYGPTKTLDVHVASLRKKLRDPTLIETVRGVGLRMRALDVST